MSRLSEVGDRPLSVACSGPSVCEPEKARGVALDDIGAQFILDRDFFKIGQPTFGRDHGPVRAEQHLFSQDRIAIFHQNVWEIFWRPA